MRERKAEIYAQEQDQQSMFAVAGDEESQKEQWISPAIAPRLITHKPITPGRRHYIKVDMSHLWKGRPVRELTRGFQRAWGRSHGKIAHHHRGGGHKRLYRFIDFKRSIKDAEGVVQRLEYDPNRSAHIALVQYPGGEVQYIVAPHKLLPGDVVVSSDEELPIKTGNAMPLIHIPMGTKIHNIELHPGKGAQICRSAGTYGEVVDKVGKPGYVTVRFASKEEKYIPAACQATIGQVSNPLHFGRSLGKAGRKRWLGWRPHVRGVAMNPVDHPMGGGEGRSSGGRPSCSRTGVLSKGFRTRKKKNWSMILVERGGRASTLKRIKGV